MRRRVLMSVSNKLAPGVYIEDINHNLYVADTQSQVTSAITNNQVLQNYSNVNSVVVITDAHSMRVPVTRKSSWDGLQMLSNDSVDLRKKLGNYDSTDAALAAFNGKAITIAAKNNGYASSISYGFGAAVDYIFPGGTTTGYLPSLGELKIIYDNRQAINRVLNAYDTGLYQYNVWSASPKFNSSYYRTAFYTCYINPTTTYGTFGGDPYHAASAQNNIIPVGSFE